MTGAPPLHGATALQSFLGLTGWFSKFIPCYASVVEPLCALHRGNIGFTWTDAAQVAFSCVKEQIVSSSALMLFDRALHPLATPDPCN